VGAQPRIVKRRRLLRVAVVGPESTGKTTLARFLARHYRTSWSPEYLRAFVDAKIKRRPNAPMVERTDVRTIARGQARGEDRAGRRARRIVFHDTNLLTSIVYYEHYFARPRPQWLERALARRPCDLYLLTDVDVPWVPDPQRDRPHARRTLHRSFRRALEERGFRYVRISGGFAARERRARAAVDAMLAVLTPLLC
jgi:NadR type nicotinamide-nucleotide adenylyltransferase